MRLLTRLLFMEVHGTDCPLLPALPRSVCSTYPLALPNPFQWQPMFVNSEFSMGHQGGLDRNSDAFATLHTIYEDWDQGFIVQVQDCDWEGYCDFDTPRLRAVAASTSNCWYWICDCNRYPPPPPPDSSVAANTDPAVFSGLDPKLMKDFLSRCTSCKRYRRP